MKVMFAVLSMALAVAPPAEGQDWHAADLVVGDVMAVPLEDAADLPDDGVYEVCYDQRSRICLIAVVWAREEGPRRVRQAYASYFDGIEDRTSNEGAGLPQHLGESIRYLDARSMQKLKQRAARLQHACNLVGMTVCGLSAPAAPLALTMCGVGSYSFCVLVHESIVPDCDLFETQQGASFSVKITPLHRVFSGTEACRAVLGRTHSWQSVWSAVGTCIASTSGSPGSCGLSPQSCFATFEVQHPVGTPVAPGCYNYVQ